MSRTLIQVPCKIGTVTLLSKNYDQKHVRYNCKCDVCGYEFVKDISNIKKTGCPNCRKLRMESDYRSYIGQRFGDLTVIDYAGSFPETANVIRNKPHMLCRCEKCGRETTQPLARLKRGGALQCTACREKHLGELGQKYLSDTRIAETDARSIMPCRKINKNNTSGVKGVSYIKSRACWIAEITFQKHSYRLGYYKKKEDAIQARKEAEDRLFGDFLDWYKTKYPDRWERLKKRKQKNQAED